ncbi:MAG: hypothetical protein AAFY77_11615, partial [Pseudomonadota bacterium]
MISRLVGQGRLGRQPSVCTILRAFPQSETRSSETRKTVAPPPINHVQNTKNAREPIGAGVSMLGRLPCLADDFDTGKEVGNLAYQSYSYSALSKLHDELNQYEKAVFFARKSIDVSQKT